MFSQSASFDEYLIQALEISTEQSAVTNNLATDKGDGLGFDISDQKIIYYS